MIEDALDPRPATEPLARIITSNTAMLDAMRRDPALLTRNWNDRESTWGNLCDLRHWIERARD